MYVFTTIVGYNYNNAHIYTFVLFVSKSELLNDYLSLKSALKVCLLLNQYVLFIPIMTGLLNAERCMVEGSSTCSAPSGTSSVATVGIILAVVYTGFTTGISNFNVSSTINPKHFLSRTIALPLTIQQLSRSILIFIFMLMKSGSFNLLVQAVVYNVYAILNAYVHFKELPFANVTINFVEMINRSIHISAGIALLITVMFNDDTKPVGIILFYGICPLLSGLSSYLLKSRMLHLQTADARGFTSTEIALKVRFTLKVGSI